MSSRAQCKRLRRSRSAGATITLGGDPVLRDHRQPRSDSRSPGHSGEHARALVARERIPRGHGVGRGPWPRSASDARLRPRVRADGVAGSESVRSRAPRSRNDGWRANRSATRTCRSTVVAGIVSDDSGRFSVPFRAGTSVACWFAGSVSSRRKLKLDGDARHRRSRRDACGCEGTSRAGRYWQGAVCAARPRRILQAHGRSRTRRAGWVLRHARRPRVAQSAERHRRRRAVPGTSGFARSTTERLCVGWLQPW